MQILRRVANAIGIFFLEIVFCKVHQVFVKGLLGDFNTTNDVHLSSLRRIQVLSNSGIATVLVLIAWTQVGTQDFCLNSKESRLMTYLAGGILGHYCCSNGDTWSSELGVLSDDQPRLITNFKVDARTLLSSFHFSCISTVLPVFSLIQPVQKGTNGGVTRAGLVAAAAAGSVLGLTMVILGFTTTNCTFDVAMKQLLLIPVSALSGLCGSVIDSLLGATLQYSGFCSVRKKVIFYILIRVWTTRVLINAKLV